MSKKTKVRQLAGRVIESVTIFHSDSDNPVSLEIRCVGGIYFCFDLTASVKVSGTALLAHLTSDGSLAGQRSQSFHAVNVLPGAEETYQDQP